MGKNTITVHDIYKMKYSRNQIALRASNQEIIWYATRQQSNVCVGDFQIRSNWYLNHPHSGIPFRTTLQCNWRICHDETLASTTSSELHAVYLALVYYLEHPQRFAV